MSKQNRKFPTLEVSLSKTFAKKLEKETGFRLDELVGVKVEIVGDPPRIVFSSAFDEVLGEDGTIGGIDAGTECNGKDNMWQGQSTCGNLIKAC